MTAADMLEMKTTDTAQEYYHLWVQLGVILEANRQGERWVTTAIPAEYFSAVTKMLRERGYVVEDCSYNNVSATICW